jgi:hypothetical protein
MASNRLQIILLYTENWVIERGEKQCVLLYNQKIERSEACTILPSQGVVIGGRT